MIFSELYGTYYNTVARIIKESIDHPLEKGEVTRIAKEYAFGESSVSIEESIKKEKWNLIKEDGTTPLFNEPSMPLTNLQKRWMKAISLDPRIKLFGEELSGLEDVKPLFTPQDIVVFDKYADGDPYADETYIKNFRLILGALNDHRPLKIITVGKMGKEIEFILVPKYLEYSEKDDKFRLIGTGYKCDYTINLGRIVTCEFYDGDFVQHHKVLPDENIKTVEFILLNERNTLERALLHFAHFKKQAEKIDEKHYKVSIEYEGKDETEILIRILSFGPMIKVTAPEHFINLMKSRLMKQKSCGQ